MTRGERLALIFDRLREAPPATSYEEAYALLCTVMTAVEDEHSGVPNDPTQWLKDGRLYPPQEDNAATVPGSPGVVRYRSVAHYTYIAPNGAIEVCLLTGGVCFQKHGSNGEGVWS